MIRQAKDDDWDGVRALWRQVDDLHASLAPAYFRSTARAPREWSELLAAPDAAVFVHLHVHVGVGEDAPSEGPSLIGFVSVRIFETPPDPAMVPLRRGHVEMLVVGRAHRRQGIGGRLMRHVSDWARGQGAAELVLTVWSGNEAAEAFYKHLGYRELSRVLHTRLG
jgi:ribosomal protein S18 acetylase RimI-like enzyme